MTLFAGNFEVKYTGTLKLKSLYRFIYDWLIDKEYESPSGADFPEILYSDSRSQPGGQEVWIWWRPTYSPQNNPFYRYILRVTFHSFLMSDVETVVAGKKVKLQKGEHKVIITALLETDYQGKWKKHPILKHFYETFWKRMIWKDIEKRKKHLLGHAYDLQQAVKGFYGQPHHRDVKRPFVPKLGTGEEEQVGP